MKNILVVTSVFLFFCVNTAYARCIGSFVNGNCYGTEVYGSDQGSGYSGYSGSTYQYDLSNPVDRNSYSIDLDAQRRDQMNLDPGRSLDRGMGQFGGGIYDY
ncbi:MAG: hypothetical protein AB2689_24600 [Candidatus Thiodiazotropha taylori]